jgi:hypothetical protein
MKQQRQLAARYFIQLKTMADGSKKLMCNRQQNSKTDSTLYEKYINYDQEFNT